MSCNITTNVRYIVLQGLYWMLFCVCSGFISLYLQAIGLTDSWIGITTAVFCIVTVILQPLLGSLCDRSNQLTWKKMILIFDLVYLVACVFMFFPFGKWVRAVLFGVLYITSSCIVPFVNTAHYYYMGKGEKINFGAARGTGSGLYALLALLIGILTEKSGIISIPICGIVVSIGLGCWVLAMPCEKTVSDFGKEEVPASQGILALLHKYPIFAVMLLGVLFMYFSHNIVATYLIQIIQSIGGGSAELGTALAIQAAVEIPILLGFSLIAKKIKIPSLMVLAGVGYLLKAVMYWYSRSVAMIYATQLTQMLSFAILAAASVYYTGIMVHKEDQTTGQALMTSMMAAGTVLGSLAGGWIIERLGIRTLLNANLVIAVAGVAIASVAVLLNKGERGYAST